MRMKKLAAGLMLGAAVAITPAVAGAFCGFYVGGADAKLFNNATMVVLMRDGMRTVLSMQNNYQGPPENFAMVVPVPVVLQQDNVKTLPRDVFTHIDALAAPRLVEYWEQDPCGEREERARKMMAPSPVGAAAAPQNKAADFGVRIEAQFTVGEYEVVILSAEDSSGLDQWLRANGYKIPEGAEPVLKPYVAKGMKFFVAKVDVSKVQMKDGQAMLSPLRFHYDSDEFMLPVRLGLLNSSGTQDLIVHILSRGKRFEVANYGNVTIPTNFDVAEDAKARFGEFYAALFDKTLEKNPGAVVTEYSWDAQTCDPCPGPALNGNDLMTLGGDALPAPETPPPPTDPKLAMSVTIDDPVSNVPGAAKLVSSGISRYQNCYEIVLRQQASPKGTVKLNATIDERGRVSDVKSQPSKDVPQYLVSCTESTTRSFYFPGNRGGNLAVTVHYDVHPAKQGEEPWFKPPKPTPNLFGFTLTRLHARYGKDALGKDLVFREAKGITGGREDFSAKEQEHGVKETPQNNFQGRYIIRHPWTGPIACQNPVRGRWGGPPGGAMQQPQVARDTAFAPRGKVQLASLVKQPLPEIGLMPDKPAVDAETPQPKADSQKSCGTCAVGATSSVFLPCSLAALSAGVTIARRRRRKKRDRI